MPHFEPEPCFATPEMTAEERKRAFALAWELTRRQRKAYWRRRLKHLGLLGWGMALIAGSESYQRLFKPLWLRRALIEPMKRLLSLR